MDRGRFARAWGLVAIALMLAPTAVAATSLDVVAHDDGAGGYWFELAGTSERNPDLFMALGEDVVITLTNEGSVEHNIHLGSPVSQMTGLIAPGASVTLSFTVPERAAGDVSYWCDPHRQLGMVGRVLFEVPPGTTPPPEVTPETSTPPADSATPLSPLPVVLVALGALALTRRRRFPL